VTGVDVPRRITDTLRALLAIATNTFREAVRNKIFGALLFFAVGVMAFSLVLGAMSVHNEIRVTIDVSLFASTLFSMVITVYVSINLLQTEIERRTIYTILSKPVPRWIFLLGKYAGILALMIVIVGLLWGVGAGLLAIQGGGPIGPLAYGFALIFLQLLVVASFALLFASFSTPLLSGMLTAGIFVLGHLHDQFETVRNFFESRLAHRLIDWMAFLLPDFASMNLSVEIIRRIPIPMTYLASATWYAVSYAAVVLFAAMLIFSRRDLL
jgi:ABC-type transport system involved in multi-copper enzyme maturation permease subunit